jgi:hypothetical protein
MVGMLVFTLLASFSAATTPTPPLPDTTSTACQVLAGASNLRYFGFYGSSMFWLDKPSYFDDVTGFTNLAWIHAGASSGDIAYIVQELEKVRSRGQQAMIATIYVDADGKDDFQWDTHWAAVSEAIQPYYDSGNILGFYLADDTWRNIPGDEVLHRLATVKARFPGTITAAIFVRPDLVYAPSGLDWIGLEMYGAQTQATWQSWLDQVTPTLSPTQKLILVPGSYSTNLGCVGSTDPGCDDVNFMIEPVLRLATNNPRVAAIVPFLWGTLRSQYLIGAGDLPNYRNRLTALGSCFKRSVSGDYNGDGKADFAVWRPSDGTWYISGAGNFQWGLTADIPVPGDYNGDRKADLAVFRPTDAAGATWHINGIGSTQWGANGDIPVPGDYDGDGITDLAVFRPSDKTWYILPSTTKVYYEVPWGAAGDIPVPGDYNGDGKTDIATWRPSDGTWYINGIGSYLWGLRGDIPVPGDYNGDGKTDLAVFRPTDAAGGTWHVSGVGVTQWGANGDIPVPADFNGDGKTDIAVFRPSEGTWYIEPTKFSMPWGSPGDIPVVNSVTTVIQAMKLIPGMVISACDLNQDGASNVADVQMMVNQALQITPCTTDLNRDGACNVVEVQRVVVASLGGACLSP